MEWIIEISEIGAMRNSDIKKPAYEYTTRRSEKS